MPTYTYRCKSCGRIESLLLPIANRDDTNTCECGGQLKRMVDAPGSVWSPTANGGHK